MKPNLLFLSFILFSISAAIFLIRRNLFIMLMALELGLNAAGLAAAHFALKNSKGEPLAWILFFFAVAAAEAAIGLALLMNISKKFKTLNADEIKELKG
ncbi:MAG: NADH-quinone oxidoreductase subunit NuoK [Elusimicrobia bacterium]|nr:NADH-quinone oxidoreductase subunit NuoK [Elusimicrobiota bacterium]